MCIRDSINAEYGVQRHKMEHTEPEDQSTEDHILEGEEETEPSQHSVSYDFAYMSKKAEEYMEPIVNKLFSDPNAMSENCLFASAQATVAGFGFGFLMGAFFSSLGSAEASNTFYRYGMPDPPKIHWRVQVLEGFKGAGRNGMFMAKTFAVVGALYSGIECVIEKKRGKADIYNAVYAGCATGGLLGIRAGPTAACFGCAGFAAFSAGIELLLGH
eukprot:TRINITY_DN3919_c0_g3_i1.p1 TRINITY_DN3919_c0_g3~~TRINITY_DN3919_c0_g3_i1.p1  ORF type:complete len:215 (-),score=43.11 TRINITY_DN3919_c0_g3_i1:72-716(-)